MIICSNFENTNKNQIKLHKKSSNIKRNCEKVKRIRKLTQQQLAIKLGTSRQNISHLESGYVEPNVDMLKKYCYFLILPQMNSLKQI